MTVSSNEKDQKLTQTVYCIRFW